METKGLLLDEQSLQELLVKKKEVAPTRKETNAPRVCEDHRMGENIAPERFASEFGFRGVQFGNYVEQVLDDKAYINMPNQRFFNFLDPRTIRVGVRFSF